MRTTLSIRGFPFASAICTDLVRQFEYTGLFFCCAGISKEALNRVGSRYLALQACLRVLDDRHAEVTVAGTPVVYNTNSWHSDRLGGYAGQDLDVSAIDLLTSHTSLWLVQEDSPGMAHGHLVRNLLWYYAECGDITATINFARDLFMSGFIVTPRSYSDVLWSFIHSYATGTDVSFLKRTRMDDRAKINQELQRVKNESAGAAVSNERVHEILDLMIEDVTDRINAARGARSVDEWLVSLAEIWAPVSTLSILFHPLYREGLTPVQRAVLSQVEETSADLMACFGELHTFAQYALPLVWTLNAVRGIGKEYEAKYGAEWLDRLADDRLLLPDAVLAELRNKAPAPSEVSVPEGWDLCLEIGAPLALAFNREPGEVRSSDFPAGLLLEACLHLGWSRSGEYKDRPPDEMLIEARRQLAAAELYTSLRALAAGHDPIRLDAMLRLYPWNATVQSLSGSDCLSRGDTAAAAGRFRRALLLDPVAPENWEAMARVCPETERDLFDGAAAALKALAKEAAAKLAARNA